MMGIYGAPEEGANAETNMFFPTSHSSVTVEIGYLAWCGNLVFASNQM